MTCPHGEVKYDYVEDVHPYTGESTWEWVASEVSWLKDLDVGRFTCTKCNQTFYYTGKWREFFENGTPCLGSDRLK